MTSSDDFAALASSFAGVTSKERIGDRGEVDRITWYAGRRVFAELWPLHFAGVVLMEPARRRKFIATARRRVYRPLAASRHPLSESPSGPWVGIFLEKVMPGRVRQLLQHAFAHATRA